MPHQVLEVEIDGVHYAIGTLKTSDGLRVAHRLGQLQGHTLGRLVGVGPLGGEGVLVLLLQGFFDTAQPGDIEAVVHKLLSQVRAYPSGPQGPVVALGGSAWEDHFAGRYGHLVRVLKACIEHNFSDFFGAFASELAGLFTGAMKSPSPAPASSTSA